MKAGIRTDLALEARELWQAKQGATKELPGVVCTEEIRDGIHLTRLEIQSQEGAEALEKPQGVYVTLEIASMLRREEDAFESAVELLSEQLRSYLQLNADATVLVAGLGNRAVTPDAIGPAAADHIIVTRHLKEQFPQASVGFRTVSVLRPGVLGTTGMESAEVIHAVCQTLQPNCIIVLDALASRELHRLCRTVQLTDTGIVPGSGVGNSRAVLNRETMGIPVIAVGVPTVVDAGTLAVALTGQTPDEQYAEAAMIVTPREIDQRVKEISRLIGYGINLALHPALTIQDIDLFVC